MNEQELRVWAIEQAAKYRSSDYTAASVVKDATAYEAFVCAGPPVEANAPGD